MFGDWWRPIVQQGNYYLDSIYYTNPTSKFITDFHDW